MSVHLYTLHIPPHPTHPHICTHTALPHTVPDSDEVCLVGPGSCCSWSEMERTTINAVTIVEIATTRKFDVSESGHSSHSSALLLTNI